MVNRVYSNCMVHRQRENAAKYMYDLSKIVFATAVVGNLVAGRHFDMLTLTIGSSIGYLFFWWAFVLDGRNGEQNG